MSIPNILSTKYHLTDPLNHTCIIIINLQYQKLLNSNSFKILSIKEQNCGSIFFLKKV